MANYGSMGDGFSSIRTPSTAERESSNDSEKLTDDLMIHHRFSVYTPHRIQQHLEFGNPSKRGMISPELLTTQESDDFLCEEDHLSLLDPYFDLTTARMRRFYDQVDINGDGTLSYEEFRNCLGKLGIECRDDDSFKLLLEKIDTDQSGGISFEEFENAVQMIKLADLFKPQHVASLSDDHHPTSTTLSVFDYSPLKIRAQCPIRKIQNFFYSRKPKWATVRWINMEGIDELNMKRLAVCYRLHPLSVEDTLASERHRPKFDSFDHHHFLILPFVSSSSSTSRVSPFRKRASLQFMKEKDLFNNDCCSITPQVLPDNALQIQQLSFFILEDTVITVQEDTSRIWASLQKKLHASYSKVRQHGTTFLVYSLLDAIVDDIAPIMNSFGDLLIVYESQLNVEMLKYNIEKVEHVKGQIRAFIRAVKPMREVVSSLIHSDAIKDLPKMYLRDVYDHLLQILEDGEENLEACERIAMKYVGLRADRQGDVMYHLTIVAAMFIPAQFLTGVFGMNFQHMPELRYQYSYPIFWIVILTFFLCLFCYFHFQKKWI